MRTLNLGILAHVDAGKTTLTERLLYAAGVIDAIGSVDRGTTQTDTLELERRRGITIKAAVVSFPIGDLTVNIIDTPGHPDFIAEVERSLLVLDGALLVVSAVEGVQPQTRVLMRALRRRRVPTLIFVNKIDRRGADPERVHREIEAKLAPPDSLPVFFGSARTGAGVDALMAAIDRLLPATRGDEDGPVSGTVFKIERDAAGEKIAYVRMFAGTLRTRDRIGIGRDGLQKVTDIRPVGSGGPARRGAVSAGGIAKVQGLNAAMVGDTVGAPPPRSEHHRFAPPTLETVVDPVHDRDRGALRAALTELAEQDPLINVRQDDALGEITVSLYGEVQQEVIQATLENDYRIAVTFRATATIHIERPARTGEAIELLQDDANPTCATIGLRIAPAAVGSGIGFRLAVDPRTIPTYIYKTAERFTGLMREHAERALRAGRYGWPVTDCAVTVNTCGYYVGDGATKPTQPMHRTTAADFRHLMPRVLRVALDRAGTVVCEPMVRVSIEAPAPALGPVLAAAGRCGGAVEPVVSGDELAVITATMATDRVPELRRQVADLTGGEGVVETEFAGYQPVAGEPPRRGTGSPS
jgi:ribosomal protection tetracycline resistance protein